MRSPLYEHWEELNTMGSYMCSLVQKSANTNWLARHFYWHELTGSRDVREYLSQPKIHQQNSGFETPQLHQGRLLHTKVLRFSSNCQLPRMLVSLRNQISTAARN